MLAKRNGNFQTGMKILALSKSTVLVPTPSKKGSTIALRLIVDSVMLGNCSSRVKVTPIPLCSRPVVCVLLNVTLRRNSSVWISPKPLLKGDSHAVSCEG